ncbi:general stress protein [Cellulomonas dongxiuzhuiae]|uniref:DUF4175 domain-containing protein n=1 Tax=Cellulomonas dongxiuzhuiae TaxID=2819979 RepID=A0ABX8GG71_9CELL|nr:general stress protein [Cellulomonas dongxiuzhuiae]MBO3094063.1 hypothetical protein [Cellulomonas dongxiuzhuiae]QWC15128.1 DUF4175 domain-containing protein [Cellulomonas dongxiuzhuiae]
MSFTQSERIPTTPTLPTGETVATYGTYLQAQKAVELLAAKEFPVRAVTIVGTDLRMVERVLRRLSYPSAALGGFLSGAWFGLFVGLILTLFSSGGGGGVMLPAVLFGGAFGLLFSVIGYSLTRGRRDFASSSQIVATSYSVLCPAEHANKARHLLAETGGVVSGWPEPPRPPVPGPVSTPESPTVPPAAAPTAPPTVPPPAPPTQPPAPPTT